LLEIEKSVPQHIHNRMAPLLEAAKADAVQASIKKEESA